MSGPATAIVKAICNDFGSGLSTETLLAHAAALENVTQWEMYSDAILCYDSEMVTAYS